jgi:hypothetical protein
MMSLACFQLRAGALLELISHVGAWALFKVWITVGRFLSPGFNY